ncbi:MAG: lipoprotein insertase outer membrane protein LolB [Candidatus Accumulibacter sp. UW20]|jgi:outer membrane lipoprotein LolB
MRCPCALLLLIGGLALTACSTLQPPAAPAVIALQRDQLNAFSLSGRFSLRHEGSSHAGRIDWQHDGDRNRLLLSSPFGQAMLEIVGDADGARLSGSDGHSQTASSVDELLQSALAYPLSLSQLADWLRGRHAAGDELVRDALERPQQLRHEDLRIAYEYDSDQPQALPSRLFVDREDGFVLRLSIDQWLPLTPGEQDR